MDGSDGLEGRIANFRMWDYELAIDQLNALSSTDKGNIVSQHLMDFTYVNLDDSQWLTRHLYAVRFLALIFVEK